jgi:hypothetical protein
MNNLKLGISEVAYHLERLSKSKAAREAVENKDERSFRKICQTLKVPQKHVDAIKNIVFSVSPNQAWPWA